jgi:hypothetical protein
MDAVLVKAAWWVSRRRRRRRREEPVGRVHGGGLFAVLAYEVGGRP